MVSNVRIEQVIRLGRVQPERQTGRPRRILIKLVSKTEKWSLKNALKNAKISFLVLKNARK